MDMKRTAMLFADGFEEVEALMTVDLLRRAGIEVVLASVQDGAQTVTGSHQITVGMDASLADLALEELDAMIIPGGMPGTRNLGASEKVRDALTQMNRDGKVVAAICAAPSVLGLCGILKGKKATCFPGFEDELEGAEYVQEAAVTDGNVITSRGLGTSMEFGFALIEKLLSREQAEDVREKIVFMYH